MKKAILLKEPKFIPENLELLSCVKKGDFINIYTYDEMIEIIEKNMFTSSLMKDHLFQAVNIAHYEYNIVHFCMCHNIKKQYISGVAGIRENDIQFIKGKNQVVNKESKTMSFEIYDIEIMDYLTALVIENGSEKTVKVTVTLPDQKDSFINYYFKNSFEVVFHENEDKNDKNSQVDIFAEDTLKGKQLIISCSKKNAEIILRRFNFENIKVQYVGCHDIENKYKDPIVFKGHSFFKTTEELFKTEEKEDNFKIETVKVVITIVTCAIVFILLILLFLIN